VTLARHGRGKSIVTEFVGVKALKSLRIRRAA